MFFENMRGKVIVALLLCIAVLYPLIKAHATFISPRRVMIADKQRAANITIFNRGNETMVYYFAWERRARKEGIDGLTLLKEGETVPGYKPADDFIIFSPRRTILKPGERQKIRLLVRRPADMEAGEYHSHFLIKADPVEEKEIEKDGKKKPSGLSGVLTVRTYASIPVMLRHGETKIAIDLQSAILSKKDDRDYLRLHLENSGTRTIYLQPKLECHDASGEITETMMTTIRVYVEAKVIDSNIPVPIGTSLDNCASLSVALYGIGDFEYHNQAIAQMDVQRR